MKICDEALCTGCMMCAEVCPKSAIDYRTNVQGFWYPHIEERKCIGCKKCEKVCPINIDNKYKKTDDIVAAWNRDKDIRLSSTSGGVFYSLAKCVLDNGGVVYGAALDASNEVYHKRIASIDELHLLSGSKYVQSNNGGCYRKVKDDLTGENMVLFSGTPCQVSALKSFLGKEYKNLICIDIVCHGVPSPRVFKDYVDYVSRKYSSTPQRINFRYKKPCWSVFSMKIDFKNGSTYTASKFKDPYLYFFLVGGGRGDLTLRRSCFECRFASPERTGDITLGDFWGILATSPKQKDQENGVNIVLINSPKGRAIFDKVSEQFETRWKNWDDAYRSNQSFIKPWSEPGLYKQFWEDYQRMDFDTILDKYYIYDRAIEDKKIAEAKSRAETYRNIPKIIKYYLRRIKNRIGL